MSSADDTVRRAEVPSADIEGDFDALGDVLRSLHAFEEESLKRLDAYREQHEGKTQELRSNTKEQGGGGGSSITELGRNTENQERGTQEWNADMERQEGRAQRDYSKTQGESSPLTSLDERYQGDGGSNDADDERSEDEEEEEKEERKAEHKGKEDEKKWEESEKKDAQQSLAKALKALTSLNLQTAATTSQGDEARRAPPRTGKELQARTWKTHHQPRVKFDINALNDALANLLTLTKDPRVRRPQITSTPPPTPRNYIHPQPPHAQPQPAHVHPQPAQAHPYSVQADPQSAHAHLHPSNALPQEVHAQEKPKGSLPTKPRPKTPNVHWDFLSQSLENLWQGRRASEAPSLSDSSPESDPTDGGEGEKTNFFAALKGKGVRQHIRTLTKKKKQKNKRLRYSSLQISSPWDFKHLAGPNAPKEMSEVEERLDGTTDRTLETHRDR